MSDDSNHSGSSHSTAEGRERGTAQGCATFFMKSALIVLGLVCMAAFLRSCEDFRPRTGNILKSAAWKPFVRECTEFSEATQNIDDGSIVFVMRPEFDSWGSYLRTMTEDATAIGWVKDTDDDGRLAETSYFVKRRAIKILKRNFDSGVPVRNYFTRQLDPEETGGRTVEVVEITLLEKTGAVMFVSFYL